MRWLDKVLIYRCRFDSVCVEPCDPSRRGLIYRLDRLREGRYLDQSWIRTKLKGPISGSELDTNKAERADIWTRAGYEQS
eukprot:1190893-Prorocentrum_minimum.AAC.1